MEKTEHSKVSIIGAGAVGASSAYAMLIRESAREVVLYDINEAKVTADATAETKAKKDRIEAAKTNLETVKKTAAATKKTGTEQEKKDAAKAVADAKKEEKISCVGLGRLKARMSRPFAAESS